jgi:hypothetical protein
MKPLLVEVAKQDFTGYPLRIGSTAKIEPARKLVSVAEVPYVALTVEASPHITYDHYVINHLRHCGVEAAWINWERLVSVVMDIFSSWKRTTLRLRQWQNDGSRRTPKPIEVELTC